MSVEHRPGRASPWRARVRTPDGRRVSKSFRRKIDAEQWLASQRTDMVRGEWIDPKAGDILLSEWLAQVAESKLNISPATADVRGSLTANHIVPFLGVWPIGRITPEVLQSWVAGRQAAGLAPATIHKAYRIITEALTLAVRRGKLVRSPDIEIELPKVETPTHRYLTDDELWDLAEAIDPRYRPFVLLGGYGGLRPGESITAQWSDIDWDRRTLDVRGTKTTSSRRRIRMPEILVDGLRQHRSDFPHLTLVLHTTAGTPVPIRNLRRRQWAQAVADTVGSPMRPHDLRHTHVALLIAQGVHPKTIADRLGHRSIMVTMDVYGHLMPGVDEDAIDGLGQRRDPQMAPKTQEGPFSD